MPAGFSLRLDSAGAIFEGLTRAQHLDDALASAGSTIGCVRAMYHRALRAESQPGFGLAHPAPIERVVVRHRAGQSAGSDPEASYLVLAFSLSVHDMDHLFVVGTAGRPAVQRWTEPRAGPTRSCSAWCAVEARSCVSDKRSRVWPLIVERRISYYLPPARSGALIR
jgi:hypothetical protein